MHYTAYSPQSPIPTCIFACTMNIVAYTDTYTGIDQIDYADYF